jgi:hypothetical protein
MLLFVAILVLAIYSVVAFTDETAQIQPQITTAQLSATLETAYEGAALYAACSASSVPPGNYTPASFTIGVPTKTPLGNTWGCVKTTGGIYGTDIVVVTFLDVPTTVTKMTAAAIAGNSSIQSNLAYQVVEDMIDRAQFAPNTEVGVIPAGSTTMSVLAPAGQTLTVLSGPLAYSTPAIVGNLYGTTPTNNVLSTTP